VDTTDQAELIADINNLINTINEHLKRVELSKRSISDAINEITVTLGNNRNNLHTLIIKNEETISQLKKSV
jgi:hypothetical protein